MFAVKTFGLTHLIETEEVEDNVRAFRCLDSFAQERCVRFAASLIAMAHGCDFQFLLFFDQVLDGLYLCGIDHGGTRALISGQEGEITHDCDLRACLQRQNAALVLKQDRTVRGGLSGQRMVTLNIEFFAVSLGRFRRCENRVQKLIDARIQVFHGKISALNSLNQLSRRTEARCGHLQVGTCLDSRDMIVGSAPVGDYKSVKSPVAAQDILEKMHALVGILAVDLVIGRHDGAGLGLIDGQLEAGQIDLAKRALIYDRVHSHAALLLGVDREVLDAGIYALALDSLHIGCRHLACQIRVFGKILEVTSAKRASLNVHAGAEQNIDAHSLRFLAERDAYLCAKLLVPAARHCRGSRKTRCRKRCVETEVVSRSRLSSESVRAVGHDHRRNVKSGNISGVPFSLAAQKSSLLLQSQLIN